MTERIDICLCTYRRPQLAETLASLAAQTVPEDVCLRLIVADNDTAPSARGLVEGWALPFPVLYLHAPAGNISVARNAVLARADGDWLAFIDDDEIAPTGWIAALLAAVRATGTDGVFAAAEALYPAAAPGWMRAGDYHSNRPVRTRGRVATGHTCNALLRWAGTPWAQCRFDTDLGRCGGEDTVFFHEIARLGARFATAPDAAVWEPVAPARLSMRWLLTRRYRMGMSHARAAGGRPVTGAALAKAGFCGAAALVLAWHGARRRYWLLRGALHCGVVAGGFGRTAPRIYGES
ncbi:glycosyltransferase family 2 protein [Algicella marina]|uniref:Glycosyltransferase n=1 Tax=Algicella marina TaxID=2683284 RepID=A0A6P1T564_9RHOB|nr:glycosyltransferase family 2 protein [Algicella marina]QHQ36419.1 glycosyltransferase [Algicella marina]